MVTQLFLEQLFLVRPQVSQQTIGRFRETKPSDFYFTIVTFLDETAQEKQILQLSSMNEIQQLKKFDPATGTDVSIYPKTKATAVEGIDLPAIGQQTIYDVSYHNSGVEFATLRAALAVIPVDERKSGMTVKYISSVSHKYVQFSYFLTYSNTEQGNSDFLTASNWQGVDEEITEGSDNLIKSGIVYDALDNFAFKEQELLSNPVSIKPNILYKLGTREILTVNFIAGQQGVVNEYMFEFTVQGNLFVLTLPSSVRWTDEPDFEDGYTYQVSVVDNLAVMAGWQNNEQI